jgi:hypothetical protein
MEKGNQPTEGEQHAGQSAEAGAAGASAGGSSADPGTGTGTVGVPPPPPAGGGGGGGAQADQSGPDREWQILSPLSQNPDGTWSRVETDGEGAVRYTTIDGKGNVVSQEVIENTNTGGQAPPAETEPERTYSTDGGTPPVGGPEPFSDVPPSGPEYRSWRDMPAQEVELPDGRKLSLDGQGGLEFQDGEQTFRREGGNWVDKATGERAPSSSAKRASAAMFELEHGLGPSANR